MHCNFANIQLRGDLDVKLGNQIIPQVTKFKYLGSVIRQDCEIDDDVNHRIQAGWCKWRKTTGVLCDTKVPHKMKGKLNDTAIRSTILYNSNVEL